MGGGGSVEGPPHSIPIHRLGLRVKTRVNPNPCLRTTLFPPHSQVALMVAHYALFAAGLYASGDSLASARSRVIPYSHLSSHLPLHSHRPFTPFFCVIVLPLLTHAFIIAHYLLFAAGPDGLGLTPMVFSFRVQVALMVPTICSSPLDCTRLALRSRPALPSTAL